MSNYPSRYSNQDRGNAKPPSRSGGYQGRRPASGNFNNTNRKRKVHRPTSVIPKAYPTRAMVRDARSRRIEKHVIDILRKSMKPETFNELMLRAKQRAAKEIEKEMSDVKIDPDA